MIAGLQAGNPDPAGPFCLPAAACCPHTPPALGPGPGFWQIRLGTPGALLRRQHVAPCWQSRLGPRARWGVPPGVYGPGAPSLGAEGWVLGRAADGNKLVDTTSSLLSIATSGKALTNALCPALCPLCGGQAASLAPTRPPRRCPDLPRSRLLKLGAARTARCGVLRRRRVLSCSTGAL